MVGHQHLCSKEGVQGEAEGSSDYCNAYSSLKTVLSHNDSQYDYH